MAEELVYNSIHTGVEIDEGISKTQQIVNLNLLDNWYFGNPVNQKGKTSYTATAAGAYAIDRWAHTYASNGLNIGSKGITLQKGTASAISLFQPIDDALIQQLNGNTLTVSALSSNNELYYATGTLVYYDDTTSRNLFFSSMSNNWRVGVAKVSGDTKQYRVVIYDAVDTTLTIVAAKLELGDQQTLAHQDKSGNWVLNEIPNYGEQLLKCQGYYQLFSSANARPSNLADYRPSMRANPAVGTIVINGTTYYFSDANM